MDLGSAPARSPASRRESPTSGGSSAAARRAGPALRGFAGFRRNRPARTIIPISGSATRRDRVRWAVAGHRPVLGGRAMTFAGPPATRWDQTANSVLYGVRIRTPALTSAKNGPGGVRATGYGRPGHCGEHPGAAKAEPMAYRTDSPRVSSDWGRSRWLRFGRNLLRIDRGRRARAVQRRHLRVRYRGCPPIFGCRHTAVAAPLFHRFHGTWAMVSGRLGRRRSATPQEPADGISYPNVMYPGVRWRAPPAESAGGAMPLFIPVLIPGR